MESYPFVLGANLQGGERLVAYPFDMHRLTKEEEERNNRARRLVRRKRQYEEDEREEEVDRRWEHIGYHQEPDEYRHGYGHREGGYHQENYGHYPERYGYHQESYNHYPENYGYHQESYNSHQESYNSHHESYGYHQESEPEGHHEGYHETGHGGEGEGYGGGEGGEGYGGGGEGGEGEEEARTIADMSLFRWLAVSYASTHRGMTQVYHGGCHGEDPTRGQGFVNRAKWKPVTGSEWYSQEGTRAC